VGLVMWVICSLRSRIRICSTVFPPVPYLRRCGSGWQEVTTSIPTTVEHEAITPAAARVSPMGDRSR
jgi:hypothetical protein